MNILQIVSNMKKNGPALVVYDLAHGLAEQGHSVYIASAEGELAYQLEYENIHFVHIPIERIQGNKLKQIVSYLPNALKAYNLLSKCIIENKIEIINSHQPIPNIYAKRLSKQYGIPFVTTSHNVYQDSFWNRTYVSGDHVIAVSEKVLNNSISRFHVSKNRITCIRNGINPNRLKINQHYKSNGKFVIGTIAGLRKQKALDNLIKAFALFHNKFCESKCVIAGSGAEEAYLKSLSYELGISESVEFWGFRSDVANVLASFDVFALPSEYEGLPISMLEAMALKIPVVVTAVGGVPEVIVNQKNGLMIKYRDNETMAKYFELLYTDELFRKQIGNAGYQTISEKYNYLSMSQQYLSIYELLCSNQ